MNANAFRHFYDYPFAENRKIWDGYVTPLSFEQFTRLVAIHGTDHRAQILRGLNDLGVKTTSQDYNFPYR